MLDKKILTALMYDLENNPGKIINSRNYYLYLYDSEFELTGVSSWIIVNKVKLQIIGLFNNFFSANSNLIKLERSQGVR